MIFFGASGVSRIIILRRACEKRRKKAIGPAHYSTFDRTTTIIGVGGLPACTYPVQK
jgi:hypothetical protein